MSRKHRCLAAYLDEGFSAARLTPSDALDDLVSDLERALDQGRLVFLCGNGGSAATASHICEDFGKGTLSQTEWDEEDVKRLRIVSLTDNTPYILAWANDGGFERIFVEQLKNLASSGDLLIAISGSGNSENVLRAVDWGNDHEMSTWGITGFDGGELRRRASRSLHTPVHDMGLVESVHLLLFHWMLDELGERLRGRTSRRIEELVPQPG